MVYSPTNSLGLVAAAARLDPDMMKLGITMPGPDGIEAARQERRAGCRAKLVFRSVPQDPDDVRASLSAAGTACVAKL